MPSGSLALNGPGLLKLLGGCVDVAYPHLEIRNQNDVDSQNPSIRLRIVAVYSTHF